MRVGIAQEHWSLIRQIARFGITGLSTFMLYLTLSFYLVDAQSLSPAVSGCIAFCLVLPLNYLMHYFWTYNTKKSHKKTTWRFLFVVALGITINLGGIYYLQMLTNAHYLIVQAVVMIAVILLNFFLGKAWIFTSK